MSLQGHLRAALLGYEQALATAGFPSASTGRPGRDAVEVARAFPILSAEAEDAAVSWWGWRDGTANRGQSSLITGDALVQYSLTESTNQVRLFEDNAEQAVHLYDATYSDEWNEAYVPMLSAISGDVLALDGSSGLITSYANGSVVAWAPAADSLLDLLRVWMELLTVQAWRWDGRRNQTIVLRDLYPQSLRHSHARLLG